MPSFLAVIAGMALAGPAVPKSAGAYLFAAHQPKPQVMATSTPPRIELARSVRVAP